MEPLAPQRFALQVTIGQETRDNLERLKNLLGHKIRTASDERAAEKAREVIAYLDARARASLTAAPAP